MKKRKKPPCRTAVAAAGGGHGGMRHTGAGLHGSGARRVWPGMAPCRFRAPWRDAERTGGVSAGAWPHGHHSGRGRGSQSTGGYFQWRAASSGSMPFRAHEVAGSASWTQAATSAGFVCACMAMVGKADAMW
ncbi:hypothetical protein [Komagataeibacter intermedius]|uniref:hypothetical protein n=1 Tax=Komagataeibacter intermedius TaxID=66229 RepID=UPI001146AF4B|nr:hypothetical protein [Komagataeibacter intermedius]